MAYGGSTDIRPTWRRKYCWVAVPATRAGRRTSGPSASSCIRFSLAAIRSRIPDRLASSRRSSAAISLCQTLSPPEPDAWYAICCDGIPARDWKPPTSSNTRGSRPSYEQPRPIKSRASRKRPYRRRQQQQLHCPEPSSSRWIKPFPELWPWWAQPSLEWKIRPYSTVSITIKRKRDEMITQANWIKTIFFCLSMRRKTGRKWREFSDSFVFAFVHSFMGVCVRECLREHVHGIPRLCVRVSESERLNSFLSFVFFVCFVCFFFLVYNSNHLWRHVSVCVLLACGLNMESLSTISWTTTQLVSFILSEKPDAWNTPLLNRNSFLNGQRHSQTDGALEEPCLLVIITYGLHELM